jgi:(2Fe-2S) ferredoxin
MNQRQHYLFVCVNRRPDDNPKGSCAARGSERVYEELRRLLAERGLHRAVARACSCSCLDGCATGPTVCVEPEHVVYGRVTVADVAEIVDALERGEVVQRLRVDREP